MKSKHLFWIATIILLAVILLFAIMVHFNKTELISGVRLVAILFTYIVTCLSIKSKKKISQFSVLMTTVLVLVSTLTLQSYVWFPGK